MARYRVQIADVYTLEVEAESEAEAAALAREGKELCLEYDERILKMEQLVDE